MDRPQAVSRDEWLAAHKELLAQEKQATIIWNLLSDPGACYQDLGPDFYHSRTSRQHRERDLIRKLEHLTGKTVTLQPGPGEQPAA